MMKKGIPLKMSHERRRAADPMCGCGQMGSICQEEQMVTNDGKLE